MEHRIIDIYSILPILSKVWVILDRIILQIVIIFAALTTISGAHCFPLGVGNNVILKFHCFPSAKGCNAFLLAFGILSHDLLCIKSHVTMVFLEIARKLLTSQLTTFLPSYKIAMLFASNTFKEYCKE